MPKASPSQVSFSGGQVSPLAEARTDLETYGTSCRVLQNMLPTIQGPAIKRPGTIYVAETKTQSEKSRLIPFEFNIEQAYVCEFGKNYIRFYTNNAQLESGGTPVEVATTYAESELFELQFAQTADIMYIVHPNHPPAKLSRTSPTAFSLADAAFDWPAFLDENPDDSITFTLGAANYLEGNTTTITSSSAVFDATHVDSYIKLGSVPAGAIDEWKAATAYAINDYVYYEGNVYRATTAATSGTRPPVHLEGTETDGPTGVTWDFHNDGSGYVKITGFTSTTVVDIEVVHNIPPQTVNFRWAFSAWSDFEGYPRAVAFYENRLIFAGTAKKPQTIWGSVSDSYEDFKSGTENADSFSYTINTNQVNTIQWLAPSRVLAIGTAGGEFIATGSRFTEAITPTNIRITRQTAFGSKFIRPVQIGPDVLFVQRSGRTVREYRYNFDIEGYVATDLNIFTDDIFQNGVKQAAYQQDPSRIVWYVTDTGDLIALTFERQQAVVGWHTHVIGGTDVEVESVSIIPHPDEDVDQLWIIVKRTINGATVRYVERMEKIFHDSGAQDDAIYMDSVAIYDGAATTTITGLDHLEGETVKVLCEGAVLETDHTVASGQIELQNACTKAIVGLAYEARLQILPIEAAAADGTAQGKTGRVNNLTVNVKDTGPGLWYGTNFDNMAEMHFREPTDLMDNPVPLTTGFIGPKIMPSGYEKDNAVALKHILPLPFTLRGMYPQLHKQDR